MGKVLDVLKLNVIFSMYTRIYDKIIYMNIKLKMLFLTLTNFLSYSNKKCYIEKKNNNTVYWVGGIGAFGLAGLTIWALSDDKKDKKEEKEKKLKDIDDKIKNEENISKKEKLKKEKEKIELELLKSYKGDVEKFFKENVFNSLTNNSIEKILKILNNKKNILEKLVINNINLSEKITEEIRMLKPIIITEISKELDVLKPIIITEISKELDVLIKKETSQYINNETINKINNFLSEDFIKKLQEEIYENKGTLDGTEEKEVESFLKQEEITRTINSFITIIQKFNKILSHAEIDNIKTDNIKNFKEIILNFLNS